MITILARHLQAVGLAPVALGFSAWLVEDLAHGRPGPRWRPGLPGRSQRSRWRRSPRNVPDLIVAQADLASDTFDELSRIATTVPSPALG
jgi:hypothetical protein